MSPFAQAVKDQVKSAFDLAASGDTTSAKSAAIATFDLAAARATEADVAAVRDAAFAVRLISHLATLSPEARGPLLNYLRAHDELARTLAFALKDEDDPKAVYTLLDRLRKERPQQVETFPTLTAAICVVHEKPFTRKVNENKPAAADPLAIFDYFVRHESQMYFGLRNVPVDLLVYVVDTTASIDEMEWALRKYAGTKDVGSLFFTIKYDDKAFEEGAAKEVTKKGYTLPNILQYGGVCADQAYFAMSVGKALGIPTAYDHARSATLSHAWVGFLQADGKRGWWNFNSGRYESYKGVRGELLDPQTGDKATPDAYVSLLAESIGADATTRQNAVALTDAGRRLAGLDGIVDRKAPFKPALLPAETAVTGDARTPGAQGALDLIELSLHQCQSYPAAWLTIGDMGGNHKLDLNQKRKWAELLQKLCGQKYPDFTYAILEPMIHTVEDLNEQARLWSAVSPAFQSRPDLAAQVRLNEARVWESNGNLPKAGQCYEEVLKRFINAGPFALDAVLGAEGVLNQMGQSAKVLALYDQASKMATKPKQKMAPEFMRQSNWYRLRIAYAKKLDQAGRTREAEAIRTQELSSGTPSH